MTDVACKCCPTCGSEISPVDLFIDPGNMTVSHGGETAFLTRQEFAVFDRLFRAFPAVVGKGELHDTCILAGPSRFDTTVKSVDVVVCKVRRKLEKLGVDFDTIWGIGYRFRPPASGADEVRREQRRHSNRRRTTTQPKDIALVAALRSQGFGITAIAQKTGLSFRAVTIAMMAAAPDASPIAPTSTHHERPA